MDHVMSRPSWFDFDASNDDDVRVTQHAMLSSWQEEKDNYVIVITHYARLTIRQSRLYSVEETNPRVMNK